MSEYAINWVFKVNPAPPIRRELYNFSWVIFFMRYVFFKIFSFPKPKFKLHIYNIVFSLLINLFYHFFLFVKYLALFLNSLSGEFKLHGFMRMAEIGTGRLKMASLDPIWDLYPQFARELLRCCSAHTKDWTLHAYLLLFPLLYFRENSLLANSSRLN